jgi:GNAT superfamily N-acetyltransferase
MGTATLETTHQPDSEALDAIRAGLRAFNRDFAGPYTIEPLAVLIRDADGRTIGGASGYTMFGWLYVELFFVPETLRGQGVGRQILIRLEAAARDRGCHSAWLDTYNPDALRLYERLGYRRFGELTPFHSKGGRFWLTKKL